MGTFINSVNCDIYIGKGAGKKLINDINDAKKSVKIISPYLSSFLVEKLITLNAKNIDVELITSDNILDYDEEHIHKLILQKRKTDEAAVEKREKWNVIAKILLYIAIGILVTLIGIAYYLQDPKLAFGLVPVAIFLLIYKLYKNKIANKRIYSYKYSQLFPFKVYMSPYKTELSNTFIHSKIYLIDNKIAYLGSLNFTTSGTKKNYETRIRTEDIKAITEIKEEINQLFNHSNLPERDIQYWGRQLYKEPIN